LDISLLKTFLEVARTRHFSRAADALFLTQSAVSARIKQLEEILGAELFVRKRNDIQLTPAGNRLLQHAETLLKGWERARQSVALDPDLSASLSVGCLFDLWTISVERWARRFRKRAPDIAMQIDILGNDALVQRLSLGMLDCAFMFDPLQTAGLEIKQIAEVPLRLYSTRPGIDIHKAMSRNYVMVDWGSAYGIIHAEKFPDLPPPALRTNSGEVAIGLLFDRGGAAYLPEAIGQAHMDAQRLFAVEHAPVINRLAYIVYRPECLDRTSMQQAMRALRGK
jgi:DNA-binding transcriptional LysR family regulator